MKAKLFFLLTAIGFSGVFLMRCNHATGTASAGDKVTVIAQANGVSLTPFPSTKEFPNAALTYGYENGKFTVKTTNYELKQQTPDAPQLMCANSKDGQHVHIIVDNGPYDAVYASPFEKAIADGSHYVLGFLGRSYHESIKTKAAGNAVKVEVKNGNFTKTEPVKEPMLFYSRPKGKYVGKLETNKVMLDFYLANTELGHKGNKVKVEVNGKPSFTIEKWEPYFLQGLPMGKNTIKLTLVDKNGKAVDAPLNPVEREFTLMEDPAPGK
jgi:hypothetical protein